MLVAGVLVAVGNFSWVSKLDLQSTDAFTHPHAPHPDIVILAIDAKSIAAVGRWPWPRSVEANVLSRLAQFSPRAVGVDINFSDKSNARDDAVLASAIAGAKFPIVLPIEPVMHSDGSSSFIYPLAEFLSPANVRTGSVAVKLAADGTARPFPVARQLTPFATQLAAMANAAPIDAGDANEVNFAGGAGTFPTYSISDFLNDSSPKGGAIPRERLENAFVLIGATASDLHDVVAVPMGSGVMAGVEWHANVLDNILLQRPLKALPPIAVHLGGALFALFVAFLLSRLRVRGAVALAIVALAAPPLASYFMAQRLLLLPYFWIEILIAGAFTQYGITEWYASDQEKRRIRRTVQNYFSPAVLDMILKNPKSLSLGGERKEVSILFSDIRSFTTITESTDPELLAKLLHEYFTEMTEEILATDGVVDKFIGDAIMAFWGAPLEQPDHADRAVRAAQGMIQRLGRLQKKWNAAGFPHVDIGVGIHTGNAIVGNMGSEKRFDYTVIGDSVNTASRLEGLNKEYKSHIIISEATREKLHEPVPARELGEVKVKGKTVAVKIYSV